MSDQFWVFNWLSEQGIDSVESVAAAIANRKMYSKLRLAAHQVGTSRADAFQDSMSLVAGVGVNLTGIGACSKPACTVKQVDDLLRHAWLYFDKILLTDLTPRISEVTFDKLSSFDRGLLEGWLAALLYLKFIGAADVVAFAEDPRYCSEHWRMSISEVGLDGFMNDIDGFAAEYVAQTGISFTPVGKGVEVDVTLRIPALSRIVTFRVAATSIKAKSAQERHRHFVLQFWESELKNVTSDLVKAKLARAPLGTTSPTQQHILKYCSNKRATLDSVAFDLDLPVLNDVPAAILVKIRKEEAPLFIQFQQVLRTAIEERIKNDIGADSESVRRDIMRDLITPGVAEVRSALTTNSKSLSRNYVSAVVGALVTTVGALVHQPLALSAGLATCAAAGGAILKAKQDRDTVGSRPMYYLFRAVEHAATHKQLNS